MGIPNAAPDRMTILANVLFLHFKHARGGAEYDLDALTARVNEASRYARSQVSPILKAYDRREIKRQLPRNVRIVAAGLYRVKGRRTPLR